MTNETNPKPGDLVPVMVEVVSVRNGLVYFRSDDGTTAYRRVGDVSRPAEIIGQGLVRDMANALEQAIVRMEDTERQKKEAALKGMWLPACEAAIIHAKVALETWKNHLKS